MQNINVWWPETPKECSERNAQIVDALIDDPKWHDRANKIRECDKYNPCGDVLCSLCRRNIRTSFVSFIQASMDADELYKVDLIEPVNSEYGTTDVKTLNNRLRQRVNRAFPDVDIKIIGSYDICLNEDSTGEFDTFWSPHWHLIVSAPGLTQQEIHKRFAIYYYTTNEISRPVKVTSVRKGEEDKAFSYCYPAYFPRRTRYLHPETVARNAYHTSAEYRLKANQIRELAGIFSDTVGYDLLFLYGINRKFNVKKSIFRKGNLL